ncbi:hypothetical protein [Cryobacterium sp. SO1]|uniref:hypothetical protein n=1 Tax=Cryobacterium sp. SO1 TaxID=1897061 RepID=UPI001022BEF0|nr:hypothetical protein [Cryobacterium sp. SO1]RZI36844.1 hypothetical protein BJQ95_00723 [Cryobacterium sp. SO1]
MNGYVRGTVTSITIGVAYPDGSAKTLELPDASEIGSIAFHALAVDEEDLPTYDVSEDDWEQNPALMVYPKSVVRGAAAGIPYCTHNGCKK